MSSTPTSSSQGSVNEIAPNCGSMASGSSTPNWTPRRELVLPNELLHKIILWVLVDATHSICVSKEDTIWENNVMEVLHQVSPAFRAISSEIAVKAFDLGKDVKSNDATLLCSVQKIFTYLNHLGAQFRNPTEWGRVSFKTIDCMASSFVFAYALYLSCTTLRLNASCSPREVFESTHMVIRSALDQCTTLCERVKPVEMTIFLKKGVEEEYILANDGFEIVEGFHQLNMHANSYVILQPHIQQDGTGPVAGTCSLMHTALTRIEGSYELYDKVWLARQDPVDPRSYELPGVLSTLRKINDLTFEDDAYNLYPRIQKLVRYWSKCCPFLNKSIRRGNIPRTSSCDSG